jgi:hypothetical protein
MIITPGTPGTPGTFSTYVTQMGGAASNVSVGSTNYVQWQRLYIINDLLASFSNSLQSNTQISETLDMHLVYAIYNAISKVNNYTFVANSGTIVGLATYSTSNVTEQTFIGLPTVSDRSALQRNIAAFGIVNMVKNAKIVGNNCTGIAYGTRQCAYLNENRNHAMYVFILYYLLHEEASLCDAMFPGGTYNLEKFNEILTAPPSTGEESILATDGTGGEGTGGTGDEGTGGTDKLAATTLRATSLVGVIQRTISEMGTISSEPSDGGANMSAIRNTVTDSRSAIIKNTSLLAVMKHKIENGKSRLNKVWWENLFIMTGVILYIIGLILFTIVPISAVGPETKAKIILMLSTLVVISLIVVEVVNLIKRQN